MKRTLLPLLLLATLAGGAWAGMPPIRHVFLIVLENESYDATFGASSPAPYLSRTLTSQGALLTHYYGIGHSSLDNYIALISGQAPNEDTQDDCTRFVEFTLRSAALDANGQALGRGCVYPKSVKTLPDQLEAASLTWKAYMEDMGRDPGRERSTCAHSTIGMHEHLLGATSTDQYAVKHNPFMYFHSIIDDEARCDKHVVNLELLREDLASADTTPNYVFITPNLCNDGHDSPCINDQPGGLLSVNEFLKTWVPRITGSPAFIKDGLLIITFDESGGGPEGSTACCGEQGLPGASRQAGNDGPGGGRIGAVLISRFIRPGTVSEVPYNHYSLLRSVQDAFGVAHLGYSGAHDLKSFGADIFNIEASGR